MGLAVTGTIVLILLDGVELLHDATRNYEVWELDEIVLGLVVLAFALAWFAWRRWRETVQLLARRTELERGLSDRHDELAFLIAATPGIIYTCLPRDKFPTTFISTSVASQLGYEPADFTGDPSFWIDRIHPDDKAGVLAELASLSTHGYHEHEYRFRRADGSYRWMHDQGKLMRDPDGGAGRIVGLWHDITDRKNYEQSLTEAVNQRTAELSRKTQELEHEIAEHSRAEAATRRLAQIVEESTNEIYVFDDETLKFLEVNSAARNNLGYTMEELADLTPLSFKTEYSLESLQNMLAPLRRGDVKSLQFEAIHRRKDGSLYDAKVNLQKYHSEERPVFAAIVEDITDLKRIEERLRQSQRLEAVGKLTGAIAHDFNNMLTAIFGNLEMLKGRLNGDDRAQQSIEVIFDVASRAGDMTRSMLAFSHQQRLNPEPVDVRRAVTGMHELLLATVGETTELEIRFADDLRPVMADGSQLESAIINLAINARDAMPNGGQLVIETFNETIDTGSADRDHDIAPGSYCVLAVSDNGVGMSPEVQEKMFEPFFTTKPFGEGSGLGLSTVFGVMKQLGGHVTVDSEEGRGTCMKLYLPITDQAVVTPREASFLQNDDEPGGTETILLVEDNTDVREAALSLLERLGYSVVSAKNGIAATEILERNRNIDLLFTDIVMPGGMTGFELAREASNLVPGIKVLCTSGYAEPGANGDASSGKFAWIGKPYRHAELA